MSAKELIDPPEPWLTVKDIDEHLKVNKESIYDWVKNGRVWRFKASEVDKWVVNSNK